jgi:PAS domain S-box-containing protein
MRDPTIYSSIVLLLLMTLAVPASAVSSNNGGASYVYVSSVTIDPETFYPYEKGMISITVILFGSLSGIILPALGIYLPNLVFIGIVLFSLFITIAISRHELFVLSPATAVPDILRTIPDAIILTGLDGTIISANDATTAVLGMQTSPLQGKNIAEILPGPALDALRSAILVKGQMTDLEVTPAGSPTSTVSIAGSFVHDPAGERAGMVLVIRDITDRKRATRALQIAGEKLGLLTQITRHDINNLVSALSGYLLLLKEEPNDPENSTYIEACMQIANRIHEQIQFTREYQEIGARQPVWQPLDQMLARATEDIPHEGIPIEKHHAPVEIYSDPMMVKVFYNIFENALRHGERLTRITISAAERADGTLEIIVEDDGVGIPSAEKESIFRYGYGENTGLGLAISRDILALTGITIAECGTEGRGARFEISVPPGAWRHVTQ